jgi:hypothetical protein
MVEFSRSGAGFAIIHGAFLPMVSVLRRRQLPSVHASLAM